MTGLSESLRNDFNVRRSMTETTKAEPNARVRNLDDFIKSITSNQQIKEEMAKWGLQFEEHAVEMTGRRLDCERILMQGDTPQTGTTFVQKSGDFSKEIRGKGMFVPVRINDWVILSTQRDKGIVDEFANTLNRVCKPLGVILNRPQVQALDNDRTSTFVEACRAVPSNMQIVVIILPNSNKERYDAIKKIFCIDHPMASQLVLQRTLTKKQNLMSFCTKIGIQMACKLGAEAWALEIPVC
jgi:aubergine-like protein